MGKKVVSALFVILIALAAAGRGEAQVALNTDPDDPVNHAIDIIVSHGLADEVIMGQRPFSRLEVARILKGARERLEERRSAEGDLDWEALSRRTRKRKYLERLIAHYEAEYARELAGMERGVSLEALREFSFTQVGSSSKPRTIPWRNGQGTIDGVVTSFDQYNQGRGFVYGSTSFFAAESNLYATPYLALTVQPRFEVTSRVDGDMQASAHVHRLYLKTGVSNFEFQIGRDNLLWGQGEHGGLMASSNPRPLDMIRLSNPYPLRIPYVGHMKWTLFVGNLGPDQVRVTYPFLYGLKWSWKPSRWFEFGLSHTIIGGGNGAPAVKWWEPVAELMPFHKWGRNIEFDDVGNNLWGLLDWRLTIPPLRYSVLYFDSFFEDSIARALGHPDNLLNQLAFLVGWYTPRLNPTGSLGLRVEYHHTPPLAYRHSTWPSGYTLNRRVIGDAIGPDADAVYLTLYWRPRPELLARLDFAFEDYDSSTYYTERNPQGGGDRIFKLHAGPHERRYRASTGLRWRGSGRLGVNLSAGYERIQNWNFEVGRSVDNAMGGVELVWRFGEFTI